ncbi:MAG: SMR family transporter [bacterium]
MKLFLLIISYAVMFAYCNAFYKVVSLTKGMTAVMWFIGGNLIGLGAAGVIAWALKNNNPNVVYGSCVGLGFVALQLLSFLWFKEPLSVPQWTGAALVCVGLVLLQIK